jgi:hypothetical protein
MRPIVLLVCLMKVSGALFVLANGITHCQCDRFVLYKL